MARQRSVRARARQSFPRNVAALTKAQIANLGPRAKAQLTDPEVQILVREERKRRARKK